MPFLYLMNERKNDIKEQTLDKMVEDGKERSQEIIDEFYNTFKSADTNESGLLKATQYVDFAKKNQ